MDRGAVEHLKNCFLGHPGRIIEDSGIECHLNSGCLNQEVSEEKNINMWLRVQACDILVKNLSALPLSEEST